jgi:hypothetical protein
VKGVDPRSEQASSLAKRWGNLLKGFTGGDPEIQAGLNRMYADKEGWPANFPKPYSDEAGAFICAAMKAQNEE